MRESTTTGMISLDGPGGLVYEVGAITYWCARTSRFAIRSFRIGR